MPAATAPQPAAASQPAASGAKPAATTFQPVAPAKKTAQDKKLAQHNRAQKELLSLLSTAGTLQSTVASSAQHVAPSVSLLFQIININCLIVFEQYCT